MIFHNPVVKKVFFFVLVVIIMIGTFFIFFLFNPDNPFQEGDPVAIPTSILFNPSPLPTPNFENQDPLIKEDLVNSMPISTDGFDIEYLVTTDAFIVTVKLSPFTTYQTEAEQWFRDRGVTNLYDYNILWNKYPGVE